MGTLFMFRLRMSSLGLAGLALAIAVPTALMPNVASSQKADTAKSSPAPGAKPLQRATGGGLLPISEESKGEKGGGIDLNAGPSLDTSGGQVMAPNVEFDPLHRSPDASARNIAGAERLRITVLGQAALSAEYTIGQDGVISIPALGRVSVRDRSVTELEELLANLVRQRTKRDAYVTVEVAKYLPVFVAGMVRQGGSHTWTPGMTVIQAVALSGGVGSAGGSDLRLDPVGQQQVATNLKYSLSLLARLRAEQSGVKQLVAPRRLIELIGLEEATHLIDAQRNRLEVRRSAVEAQINALMLESEASKLEVTALEQQKLNLEAQLPMRRDLVKSLMSLYDKKVVSNTRLIEAQTSLSQLEEKVAENMVAIARANTRLHSLQSRLVQHRQQRREEIASEIERLEREVDLLEVQIAAAGNAQLMDRSSSRNSVAGGGTAGLQFRIARLQKGERKVIEGDLMTELQPGDVLLVGQPPAGGSEVGFNKQSYGRMLESPAPPTRRLAGQ
jgi:protein involved in polysaccharide export with SLBB domain